MKNIFGMIATVVVAGVLSLASPLVASASGYINQTDINVIEELGREAEAFWSEVESSNTTPEKLILKPLS